MSDLIAYLKARLDEEEALARAATQGTWRLSAGFSTNPSIDAGEYDTVIGCGPVECMRYCYGGTSTVDMAEADATHIAYWDPARVLADIAVRREILEWHEEHEGWCLGCELNCKCDQFENCSCDIWRTFPCPTVLAFAHPYADRDDFNPAWKTQ